MPKPLSRFLATDALPPAANIFSTYQARLLATGRILRYPAVIQNLAKSVGVKGCLSLHDIYLQKQGTIVRDKLRMHWMS